MTTWFAAKLTACKESAAAFAASAYARLDAAGPVLVFVGAMAMIGVGFWMAWTPLGLIVPGLLIALPMIIHHMRGGPNA